MSPPASQPNRRHALLALGAGALTGLPTSAAETGGLAAFSAAPPGATQVPGWRHQTLPKVARHNQFDIVSAPGNDPGNDPDIESRGASVLRVESKASASSWLTPLDHDAASAPWLHWRWRVSRALTGSDLRSQAGDDYAARLYVLFALPPERLSLGDRLRIQAARLLAGAEVPAAALCYVWGRAQPAGSAGWNPYTNRVRMRVLDSGDTHTNHWRQHVRHLPTDWAEAFGGEMPRVSGIALSADTDNTGEQVTTWFGDVRLAGAA